MSFRSIVGIEHEDNIMEQNNGCFFPIDDTYESPTDQMTFLYSLSQYSELNQLVFSYRHGAWRYHLEYFFSNCT